MISRSTVPSWRWLPRWTVAMAVSMGVLASFAAVRDAAAQPRQPNAELRGLLADLGTQLRLAHRDNLPEFKRRHEELRTAVLAWNASAKSDADRRQMAEWLRESIRRSMPGSAGPLPDAPSFAAAATAAPPARRSVTVRRPLAPPDPPQPPVDDDPEPVAAPTESEAQPTSAGALPDAPPSEATADEPDADIWSQHPAAGELPPELAETPELAEAESGDPFGDDPLAPVDPLGPVDPSTTEQLETLDEMPAVDVDLDWLDF